MKIMVPTDFSSYSQLAADYAAGIARGSNGEVVFYHIIETPIDWVEVDIKEEVAYPEIRTSLEHARQRLKDLKDHYSDVKTDSVLSINENVAGILDRAEKGHFDLIVAGTHGRGYIDRLILGSVAQKLIRLATCPVVVLKAMPEHHPPRRMLFISDFREPIIEPFSAILRVAGPLGTEMHLGFINTPFSFESTNHTEERMDVFAAAFPGENLQRHIYNHVRIEDGAHQLANRIGADCLALVTHGRTGWNRLFSHSLTEQLALESDLPVWSCKLTGK